LFFFVCCGLGRFGPKRFTSWTGNEARAWNGQFAMIRRGLSSVTDARNVKSLLRRVYLKVHPDLFGKYPDKQSVNQASMQELQSLYDELVSGRNLSLQKTRTIVFHIRDETSTTSSREMKDPENFREVTLSFSGVNGFLRSLDELVGGNCSPSSGQSQKNYSARPNSRPASTNIIDFLSGSEGAAHRSRTIVSSRSSKDKVRGCWPLTLACLRFRSVSICRDGSLSLSVQFAFLLLLKKKKQ